MKKFFIGYITLSSIAIAVLIFKVFNNSQNLSGILRVKGIVIEDSLGNDRILIGAPIPQSKYRVFTDSAKVRKFWASHKEIAKYYGNPKDGDKYMKNYSKINKSLNGILFMNHEGFDRVIVGENLCDPNIGRRNGKYNGLLYNTLEGFERGGLGVNDLTDGGNRVMLGIDNGNGEAIHLGSLEDGSNIFRIAYPGGYILLGQTITKHPLFNVDKPFSGIIVRDSLDKTLYELNVLDKK